jgi:NAD(P)-dependent dehydrogenase (short-subunit alcohol dehydrogenase family)
VELARNGADIVACDLPGAMRSLTYPLAGEDDMDETVGLVGAEGRRCLAVPTDVRDRSAVDGAVQRALDEFGHLDIVVANAGVVVTGPLDEMTDEAWDEVVATNLTGVFHTLRAVVPPMRDQQWGRIVVTSSMGGRMGIPRQAAYNATKWGVIGLAKSLALEVAKQGITVNVVCPTTVQTPMVQPDPAQDVPDEVIRQFLRGNPVPRPWIQSEDVTRAVLYLVCDPGVLTGTVMDVSLGSSARLP